MKGIIMALHPINELTDAIRLLVSAESTNSFVVGQWVVDKNTNSQELRIAARRKVIVAREHVAALLSDLGSPASLDTIYKDLAP
jgi:hypothetical protein